MRFSTGILTFAALATLLVWPSPFTRAASTWEPATTNSVQTNKHDMTVDIWLPETPGKHPAILLLHGADGLQIKLFTLYYHNLAHKLATDGYVVWMPHYFESTDSHNAGPAEFKQNFIQWMIASSDTLTEMAKQPSVDPDRMGTVGLSLGATLCLYVSAVDPRIKVTTEYFGGVPEHAADTLKRMPPVLILHGGKDPIVNVEEAYKLEKIMKDRQFTYDMKIYPDQGHGFIGADFEDAYQRTVKWMDGVLKK